MSRIDKPDLDVERAFGHTVDERDAFADRGFDLLEAPRLTEDALEVLGPKVPELAVSLDNDLVDRVS